MNLPVFFFNNKFSPTQEKRLCSELDKNSLDLTLCPNEFQMGIRKERQKTQFRAVKKVL